METIRKTFKLGYVENPDGTRRELKNSERDIFKPLLDKSFEETKVAFQKSTDI